MANDGQIVFEVTADGKHAIADIKEITRAIEKESKNWDKAAKQSTDTISDSFTSMLKKVTAGITAAKIGQMLLNIGKDALQAASDLEEVQNVVDVTFGESANQIDKWAKNAGIQFGLTETQAKKFASTMGAMMKSSGVASKDITQMSTDLAGLAADMASFYNLDFETAFQKIRSGISGETEPLKQLGINMSVANLEAFALQQGLSKTFSQMSQGEQTMLRYQYIMQQTADAQGDFSRTSDGYANSLRQMQTNIDQLKTKLGQILVPAVKDAIGWINQLLDKFIPNDEKTVIDQFNEIDADTEAKLADLEATYVKANNIIDLLKKIGEETVTLKDGSTKTFEELFKDIGNVEANGGDVRGYLESLGLDVDYVISRYQQWQKETKHLAETVPELSDAINKETGAIDGGTDALKENLDAWKANEEKKLAWSAYYAKQRALEEKKANAWLLELDMMGAQVASENARKALTNYYGTTFDELGRIIDRFDSEHKNRYESGKYDNSVVDADFEHYRILLEDQKKAEEAYKGSVQDTTNAEKALDNVHKGLVDRFGEVEDVTEDAAGAQGEMSDAIGATTQVVIDAVQAMKDYAKGVRDSVEQSVNSVIKGFEKISTEYNELEKKRENLAAEGGEAEMKYLTEVNSLRKKFGDNWMEELQKLGEGSKEWKDLSDEEKEAYNALVKIRNEQKQLNDEMNKYKPEGMMESLQSQLDFMNEYMDNLDKAKKMGLSNELLAYLSDGSTESASFLKGLLTDPEKAKEVDALYQKVGQKKQEFTDTLTDQQLTVDQVYQQMVKDAKKAVAELDQSEIAGQNSQKVVDAIASGIDAAAPAVRTAVQSILDELSRLDGWNVNLSIGSSNVPITGAKLGKKAGIQEFAIGLDHVPFDGFLASLHEGEGILTAEENRIWQRFKAGSGIDYDTMGGVMRDNIKPGGNVYLDGRVVGSVISDQQGKSYRQLQRSGWQG